MERHLSYSCNVGSATSAPPEEVFAEAPIQRGHYGSEHRFSSEGDGQEQDTLAVGVKLNQPLCFISSPKINSPSSIAQKGSISKPCLLPLGPGPFVSGQGVRRLCPSARRPDSGQTGPSCRCTQQISCLNGRVGTSATAVWTAAACFLCQGFFCNSSVAIILAAAATIEPIASI